MSASPFAGTSTSSRCPDRLRRLRQRLRHRPACALGGRLKDYSNTRPWSGHGNPNGHENNEHVQLIGKTAIADACEAACESSPSKNCTSWVWHAHDQTVWDGHCYKRSDGQWMPVPTQNDVSGRVNDTVYPPPSPPTPGHHGPLRYDTKVTYSMWRVWLPQA